MRKIYQIYIDYVFLLNFVFLFCIWDLTSLFLPCPVTQRRRLLAAFLGAVISCICFFLPWIVWYRLLLGTFLAGSVGICSMLSKTCGIHSYIKYFVIALEMGVLLGGSIALLQKFIVQKEFFIGQMLIITLGISLVLKILLQRFFLKRQKLYYPVTLYCGSKEYRMRALLDTGNSLVEPISQKKVCLIGRDYFEKQMAKEGERKVFQPQKFRAIPYHAVGTPNGILHGYEMDRLIIFTDERRIEIKRPVIGISEHGIGTEDSYQMILQPGLLEEGVK